MKLPSLNRPKTDAVLETRFPFVYEATVTTAERKQPTARRFLDSFEIGIPMVRGADAPVAVAFGATRMDEAAEIRLFEGRFYTTSPVRHPSHEERAIPANLLRRDVVVPFAASQRTLEKLFEAMDIPYGSEAMRMISDWYAHAEKDYAPPPVSDPARVTEWLSSDRDAALEKAAKVAAGIVLIDGRVHFSCEEPKLVVMIEGPLGGPMLDVHTGGTEIGAPILREFKMFVGDAADTVFFNTADSAPAGALIERIENEFGATATRKVGEIDIRIPDVFGFDPLRDFLRRAVRPVVEDMASEVGSMEGGTLANWLSLREKADLLEGDVSREQLAEIEQAYRSFVEAIGQRRDRYREVPLALDALGGEAPISRAMTGPKA